jgi:glutaryl-CoA dehydrogenase
VAPSDIGRARGTDYFLIRDQLTDSELDYLRRTRQFVDDDVLPVINDYWEQAQVPFGLIDKMPSSTSSAMASSATAVRP